jgi:hypothetical protein
METDPNLQRYLSQIFVEKEFPIIWQPDSEVSQCNKCGKEFHVFFRKHHCMIV